MPPGPPPSMGWVEVNGPSNPLSALFKEFPIDIDSLNPFGTTEKWKTEHQQEHNMTDEDWFNKNN